MIDQTFNNAIRTTIDQLMQENNQVVLLGLGITDAKGFFDTTTGLVHKYSTERVLECPTSENAYLGHALGLSLGGYRPIVHFQRMDFMLYAFDQLINNIAKWKSMFNQSQDIPLVIRTLIGMGARKSTNRHWAKSCHEFRYYENLVELPVAAPDIADDVPVRGTHAPGWSPSSTRPNPIDAYTSLRPP